MRPLTRACALIALLAVGSCDDGRDGTDGTRAVVGPQGGTLVVEGGSLDGVRVDIPAGALAREAHVAIEPRDDGGDLPDLPVGLAAFAPIAELSSDVPFERDVRLTFPIAAPGNRVNRIPSGFHAEEDSETWLAVPLDALESGAFTIETRLTGTWRWGVTLVDEVEYETLRPAVETVYGVEEVASMEEASLARFPDLVGELAEDEDPWSDCGGVQEIADLLLEILVEEERDVQEALDALGDTCGGCRVTPDRFVADLISYLEAKFKRWIGELLIEAAAPNFLLELVMKLRLYEHYQNTLDGLSCDYECLTSESRPELWSQVGTYVVTEVALAFLYIGNALSECPPLEL